VGSVVTKKYKLGQKKPMTSLAFGQILNFLEYIKERAHLWRKENIPYVIYMYPYL
jgi:hypothetical protein